MRRNYLFLFLFIFVKPQKYIWRPTLICPLFSQYNDKLFPCFFLYVYRKGTCESKDSKVCIFLFYREPLWSRCLGVHVYTCVSIHTHTNQIHTHTFMCDKVCPSVIVRWWNKVSLPSSTLVQRWNSH